MTTAAQTHTEETIAVAGLKMRVLKGGSGPNAVWLHHSTGSLGWLPFHETLAERFTVHVPDLPGYGQSERPVWARHPRDIAVLIARAMDRMGLPPALLIGHGFGGWIAAELATMSPSSLSGLVLVGAAGVQPEDGEIMDQIMWDYDEYVRFGFSSDDAFQAVFGEEVEPGVKELWDFSREMTSRLTWKPWMFNRQLVPLLSEVNVPTLLVWGDQDRVVPRSAADIYKKAIPNAKLEIVKGAGHLVEMEKPDELATLIGKFAAG